MNWNINSIIQVLKRHLWARLVRACLCLSSSCRLCSFFWVLLKIQVALSFRRKHWQLNDYRKRVNEIKERGMEDLLLQKAFSINENAHNLRVIKLKAITKQMRQGLQTEAGRLRLPERCDSWIHQGTGSVPLHPYCLLQ